MKFAFVLLQGYGRRVTYSGMCRCVIGREVLDVSIVSSVFVFRVRKFKSINWPWRHKHYHSSKRLKLLTQRHVVKYERLGSSE